MINQSQTHNTVIIPKYLSLFHSTALQSYLGSNMTGSMCDFSIQHYACLPQVALSQFCTLCTDTVHVKLFDFIILSVISGIQTQSRAAVTAHRVTLTLSRSSADDPVTERPSSVTYTCSLSLFDYTDHVQTVLGSIYNSYYYIVLMGSFYCKCK